MKRADRHVLTWAPLLALAASGLLAGCGEKPQVLSAPGKKADAQAWQGEATPYTAAGFKPGDAAAWEAQIRSRNENQNEYTRAPAAAKTP